MDKKIADKFTKSRFCNCACKNNIHFTPQKSSNGACAQRMKTISSHLKLILGIGKMLFSISYKSTVQAYLYISKIKIISLPNAHFVFIY